MIISPEIAKTIWSTIQKAHKIAIISHRNPDADSIGSNLALYELLTRQGKQVTPVCVDPMPSEVKFLENLEKYQQEFNPLALDLLICVDAGSSKQTGFLDKYPELKNIVATKLPLINIDHHASNENYGTINLVLPNAASTTMIIYELLQLWDEKITKSIATALLSGLYYDTGSFMHSNTSEEVYQVAGQLMQRGADFKTIARKLFRSHSMTKLRLWGELLNDLKQTDKNIVVAGLQEKDFKRLNATAEDISGAIDYLSMAKDNEFAAMLIEDGKGNVRGSLRSRKNDHNLSEIAALLGGGGHKKASGFTIKGKLKKETVWAVVDSGDGKMN